MSTRRQSAPTRFPTKPTDLLSGYRTAALSVTKTVSQMLTVLITAYGVCEFQNASHDNVCGTLSFNFCNHMCAHPCACVRSRLYFIKSLLFRWFGH